MSTKARQRLNRLIESIQQTEIKELERQRKRLAAYAERHEADIGEDSSIAAVIRELENYLSNRTEAYITTMNHIEKALTGRDVVAEFAAENGLQCVDGEV